MEDLDVILVRCARICGTTVARIREGKKRSTREVVDAKQLFVYCALHENEFRKKKDIAAVLRVGQYQVTYYRKKAEFSIRHERWFQSLVEKYYKKYGKDQSNHLSRPVRGNETRPEARDTAAQT